MNAPSVLEVNTAVWLDGLGSKLDMLEESELKAFAGRDYVWMMGIWERSEAGRQIARTHTGLQQEFYAALNDYTVDDVIGSAYAVRAYRVDRRIGSRAGLANVRKILHERFGVKLILDFIPNHCAVDGDWPQRHPEWFISGHGRGETETFQVGTHRLAHGRDPYFAPWTDTAQYDYSNPEFRRAMIAELLLIAEYCDGVRCDMAMLMLQDVFTQTWGRDPQTEFWAEAIKTVKARFPHFLFIAEAYWNREWQLLQLGFDFCYDKTLYDRLRTCDAHSIAAHLQADLKFASRVIRFSENHDEPPALHAFGPAWWAATLICATVPGGFLEYLGQGERTVRMPVQLGRAPEHDANIKCRQFLHQLAAFRRELPESFEVMPCPHPHVVAYRRGDYDFFVNLSGQGVHLSTDSGSWRLPAYGATVLQPLPVPLDWLHQLAVAA